MTRAREPAPRAHELNRSVVDTTRRGVTTNGRGSAMRPSRIGMTRCGRRTLVARIVAAGNPSCLVDSPEARTSAEADARNTLGAWNVRDEVLVQPGGRPTDADLERAAKRALAEDAFLSDPKSIEVSAVRGTISLKGTLPSASERFEVAGDIAKLPGVVAIDDRLTVRRPIDAIKASIEARIFWDPMVQRDRVTVTVAPGGIATLSGTLDSWGEVRAASDDALKGGAMKVVNVLKLKKHPEFSAPSTP